jgi:hypothetical protein
MTKEEFTTNKVQRELISMSRDHKGVEEETPSKISSAVVALTLGDIGKNERRSFPNYLKTPTSSNLTWAQFSSSIDAKKFGFCISTMLNFKNAKTLKMNIFQQRRSYTVWSK